MAQSNIQMIIWMLDGHPAIARPSRSGQSCSRASGRRHPNSRL